MISVVLCTYNRCESLRNSLKSVLASQLPPSVDWEIVVVDNNSSDQTAKAVEQISAIVPSRIRYLFEPRPGKSHALNAGICAAGGDVIAFMDDDVTVGPTWLRNLTAPLESGAWAGVGGRVIPEWRLPPPSWLPVQDVLGALVSFDLGDLAGPLREPPFGTNMAFRKAVFKKYGGFRLDLGPQPGCEIRGEDSEFGHRLLSAGEQLWYEPNALVYHPVPEDRCHPEYFLSWWFDKGRAGVREQGQLNSGNWTIANVPLYLFRRLLRRSVQWIFSITPSRRLSNKLKVWTLAGAVVEHYRRRYQTKEDRCEALRQDAAI